MPSADLIGLLDEAGYARYDFRTTTRLVNLSEVISQRYDTIIGQQFTSYPGLRAVLDALPGWGPVTTSLFLRELRGVWQGAEPPLDERGGAAARHLRLISAGGSALGDDPDLRNDLGLLFLVTLDGQRMGRVEAVPLKLRYARTELAAIADRAWIRDRFTRACATFGTSVNGRLVAQPGPGPEPGPRPRGL